VGRDEIVEGTADLRVSPEIGGRGGAIGTIKEPRLLLVALENRVSSPEDPGKK
jgi:hypothetical protein